LTLSGAREEDRNVENLLLIQPVPNPWSLAKQPNISPIHHQVTLS
jgi:hypothetical protein